MHCNRTHKAINADDCPGIIIGTTDILPYNHQPINRSKKK